MNITNIDIAILHKFNKVAERYGFHPADFVVTVHEGKNNRDVMEIEICPRDPLDDAKLGKMMDAMGIAYKDRGTPLYLEATADQPDDHRSIYDALAEALEKAPRTRGR